MKVEMITDVMPNHTQDFTTIGDEADEEALRLPVVLCTHKDTSNWYKPGTAKEDQCKSGITVEEITFEKLISEIYLDFDEFYLSTFGIKGSSSRAAKKEINEHIKNRKSYSLENLIKFGLDFNAIWFGCYVFNVEPGDIVSVRNKEV
jgi:hypothetical protein